jgi:tetratricopeptide (TPR) repeat protein
VDGLGEITEVETHFRTGDWQAAVQAGVAVMERVSDRDARKAAAQLTCEAAMKLPESRELASVVRAFFPEVGDLAAQVELFVRWAQSFEPAAVGSRIAGFELPSALYQCTAVQLYNRGWFAHAEAVAHAWEKVCPGEAANPVAHLMAWIYWRQLRYADALRGFERAHERFSTLESLQGRGIVLAFMGRYEESARCFEELDAAKRIEGNASKLWFMALFGAGRVKEAFETYESRVCSSEFQALVPDGVPRWDGRPIKGRLLVLADPGWSIGDYMMYVRYIGRLRDQAGSVRVQVWRALHEAIENAYDHVETSAQADASDCEAYTWLMSLPVDLQDFTTVPASIPWMNPGQERAQRWQQWWADQGPITGKRRIGVCWRGNPHTYHDAYRSMDIRDLAPMFAQVHNVDWVNLQLEARGQPGPPLPEGSRWLDPMPMVGNVLDTAAVINTLDEVLTVDTAVAHICGSVGFAATMLVPRYGEWRWQRTSTSAWYPQFRLLRTSDDGSLSATAIEWGRSLGR